VLFQDAQLSSSEFATAKDGPSVSGDAMDITLTDGGIETRMIYERRTLPRLIPRNWTKLNHLAATDVQILVRDELACAREFDVAILVAVAEPMNIISMPWRRR